MFYTTTVLATIASRGFATAPAGDNECHGQRAMGPVSAQRMLDSLPNKWLDVKWPQTNDIKNRREKST